MRFTTALAAFACLALPALEAQKPPVHLLVSNGIKAAVEELKPQCERAIGQPLDLQFGSTAVLNKRIRANDPFDVTIITSDAISHLIEEGKLAASPRAEVARSELSVGIRVGAPKPDIRTPEALKHTLETAASLTYPVDGATRGYIDDMFRKMGIAEEVKPKIILAPTSGAATESVAEGKAAIVVTLFSEIAANKGLELVGPLPGKFQYGIDFSAGMSSASAKADAARAVIAFFASPKAAKVYRSLGLTPVGR